MKQKQETKMFIYVKKHCKPAFFLLTVIGLYFLFVFAKQQYHAVDFDKTFGSKAIESDKKLQILQEQFKECALFCHEESLFLQSIVFPEVMRYNQLKDDIETESLRTLYVQFGEDYANFSIGLFQMKPSFAVHVEEKVKQLLPDNTYKELQLAYTNTDAESIRAERLERLEDDNWQLVYLTAFVLICKETYKHKKFTNNIERLQYYATVYNAGFDRSENYISKKITQENYYLNQQMPGKKFKYAALAKWFFEKKGNF